MVAEIKYYKTERRNKLNVLSLGAIKIAECDPPTHTAAHNYHCDKTADALRVSADTDLAHRGGDQCAGSS
jgi:hypothetical protein